MVKWQFWSFLITQVFIILLTQLLCGFYNRKVSKNIIRGNQNLKEERALGERILFDRRISAGEQRAESSDIKKKKKVKTERKWCCPGPTDIRWRKKTERTPAWSWGASKWKGAVGGGRDERRNQEENETCSKWVSQMPSLLLVHPQETYSKDPHTSLGSLRWMWFHSQKHRSFGPKNDWQ